MKYNSLFIALLIGSVASINIQKGEDANVDDIDALMDKYDTAEEQKNKPKPAKESTTKNGVTVTKGDIQNAELRILQGNNVAESSQKAYDDDLYNGAIDKYATDSKEEKGTRILTKDAAKEACVDLFQNKDQVDNFDAQDKVMKKFNKLWEEHDNLKKGFIDTSEAYVLMQDMSKQAEE